MKKLLMGLFITYFFSLNAQVTEPEKTLRKQTTDTVHGWKTGTIINISVTQSSFTNWSAGGQNSLRCVFGNTIKI